MKICTLFHCLYALTVLATLQSCNDHQSAPQPNRFRLKRTVATSAVRPNSKDTVIVTYTYNQQGNLDVEDYVHTNTYDPQLQLGHRSFFTYNAQNQLIKIDTRITNNKIELPNRYATRLEYTYDSDGRIKTETSSESTLVTPNVSADDPYQVRGVNTFMYNGSRFPTTVTNSNGVTNYTYNNGNVVLGGYTYDDKPNPYYGVIRSEGFKPRVASVNNAIELYPADSKYKQVMSYDALGRVTRIDIIYTNPDDLVYNYSRQYVFEYEAY